MRWDHLFDDLAGQLEHELQAEELDLQQEEERLRLSRLDLRDRLAVVLRERDPERRVLTLRTLHGGLHRVRLRSLGRDWLAGDLAEPSTSQVVVPLRAVESLVLDVDQAQRTLEPAPSRDDLSARLGLSFLLRDLCRRRTTLSVLTAVGELHGTVDRVGRDHLDLAVHDRDAPRRAANVTQVRVVPLDQVLLVRL
jgi:plasmid stabilization system protein ParE